MPETTERVDPYEGYQRCAAMIAKHQQAERDGVKYATIAIGFWRTHQAQWERELDRWPDRYPELSGECPACGGEVRHRTDAGRLDPTDTAVCECGTRLQWEADADGPMWDGEDVVTVDHSHWVRVR